MHKTPCQIWVKKKTRPKEENGLASSPSRSSPRRRRHHPRRQLPASSDAAQHAPQLPRVRSSLPSGQILRSRPLPPARNATPMARVSGRASPARLRRPRFVPPSFLAGIHHPYTSHSLHVLCCRCRWSTPWDFPIHHGRRRQGQEGTLASSTSSPRMTSLLHQDRASNPHLLSISPICTSPFF